MPIVQGRGVAFGRHVIGGLLPNARAPLTNAWTNYSKKISESVRRFIKLVETWRRRARSRRELMARTDQELRDLGITRHDVSHEVAKPFWKE